MKRFSPIVAIVVVCWVVFIINNSLLAGSLTHFGITPRRINSLLGIIYSPFLHLSFRHLLANTLPLLILGGIICARNRVEFIGVTLGGIFIGGALTWLLARNACHVGASGLVFCYFGFLASRAYFDRTIITLFFSIICIVGYGGILTGLLPLSSAISWESHLAGLIAGITIAWIITNQRRNTKALDSSNLNNVVDGNSSNPR